MESPAKSGDGNFRPSQVVVTLEEKLAKLDTVGEQFVMEACLHFTLMMMEIETLREDMERLRLIVVNLATKVDNVNAKVDVIEVTIEIAVVGVLKEPFGLHDLVFPRAELLGKCEGKMITELLM